MTPVTELELPSFDYADPELRGERFHAAMRELREQSWIASMPLGFVDARARGRRVLPAQPRVHVPGA